MLFKTFEKTQLISLYWFAAQQQTNPSRGHKIDWFYPKCSPEFHQFNLTFWKQQEVPKKGLKLKQFRKSKLCDIRCLRVNSQVKNPQVVSKEGSFIIHWLFITF